MGWAAPETIVSDAAVVESVDVNDTPVPSAPKLRVETKTRRKVVVTVSDAQRYAHFMTSTIGYARVSTRAQNVDSQVAELEAAGCVKVFVDHGESSRIANRPRWRACLEYLREGDMLTIRALDRIAGTEQMALEEIRSLATRGIRLRSLTEPFLDIDATTPMGEAMLGFMAVLAQLRVSTIRENTKRGVEHARRQGRVGGRPTVMNEDKTREALRMRAEAGMSFRQIANILSVGEASVRRAVAREASSEIVLTPDVAAGLHPPVLPGI
ncbi:recombinase family protein [Pseudoclavibacter helvolus]|uniref:recombinase family protein n=1 Tax=Pseudoclavibacter helvolus TaxID=255205 RepID=UPI003C7116C3